MRKFIVFCLMAFMVCISANGQQRFEDGVYRTRQITTSTRLNGNQYEMIKNRALKNGETFHFEYEPMMYSNGVRNERIGYNILLYGNLAYLAVNGFVYMANSEFEDRYKPLMISTCVVGILDIIATCYICVGSKQKHKSTIAVSPSGVRYTF